jgi:hypothetical protein
VTPVEFHQFFHIHVTDTVTIGHHKGLIANVGLNPLDTAAGHGIQTRIHNGHLPGFTMLVVDNYLVPVGKVEGYIRGMQIIIRKPFLDHMLLVACANHKFIETVGGIGLHNMPQNGHAADFDHGLGFIYRFFGKPGAQTTGQQNDFHKIQPFKLK